MRARLVAPLLCALLAACSTTGRPIDADSVAKIERNRSTQSDVRRWFGEPQTVQMRASGGSTWRYVHVETQQRDTRTLTKIGRSIASILGARIFLPPVDVGYEDRERHVLVVQFDSGGRVADYTYERTQLDTRRVY